MLIIARLSIVDREVVIGSYGTLLNQYLPDVTRTARAPAGTPFYLEPWFGFVILAGWVVVSLGLGYLRFQRTDL